MAEKIRPITKVRLKWVKNRGLDHIIDRDTSIKASVLLKNMILRAPKPSSTLSSRFLAPLQKTLGLTFPVLRFLRRYPTLFTEIPDPRYPSVPTFALAPTAHLLHQRELDVNRIHRQDAADRLARILMMCNSRALPVKSIIPLGYDLGLPHDFLTTLIPEFPDLFKVVRKNGFLNVALEKWDDKLAFSELERMNKSAKSDSQTRGGFTRPSAGTGVGAGGGLIFPMSFPRGYGAMKKVRAWMEEFNRLPYLSPYEDVSRIHPESEIMEKHVVGVLHELLSLTIHKKTKRNYIRCLREEMNLPQKFTRVFTRYPGIFYLSLKCKTTTITLREGYRRGKLIDPHPLTLIRDKYYYVMRTGVLYRGKAAERLLSLADVEMEKEKNAEEADWESEDEEFCEGTASDDSTGSDDD